MRLAVGLVAVCALAAPAVPAAAAPAVTATAAPAVPATAAPGVPVTAGPPGMAGLLLTTADLPAGYRAVPADENPYRTDLFEVIGKGAPCRLPAELSYSSFTWERSVSATFLREGDGSEDDETMAEVVADRGAGVAGALVDAAAAMPRQCPEIDTPRSRISMSPITVPTIGDRSAAFRVDVGTKSNSASEGVSEYYFDSWSYLSIAVAAVGTRSVVVVLMGTSEQPGIDLAEITGEAVARVRSGQAP
ncbi:hypothetical protein [Actinoplanes sp. CA-252034]|uniref:hypothetical protein n=1 Tax=Actinoplanes sp. CA-252034 TaxID=3239906 RepID=UPI003D95EBB2